MVKIKKGKHVNPKITPPKKPFYTKISNQYASLPAYSPVGPPNPPHTTTCSTQTAPKCVHTGTHTSRFRQKAAKRYLARVQKRTQVEAENNIIDEHTTMVKDETTALAKSNTTKKGSRGNSHPPTIQHPHGNPLTCTTWTKCQLHPTSFGITRRDDQRGDRRD